MATTSGSLQDLMDRTPDFMDYLFNDTPGTHSRNRAGLSPVPAEFSNWRTEQRAWRESVVLFDQSHHMPELFVSGPDALKLLSSIAVNRLSNLRPGIAKQFVATNERGQVIGECVLHDHGGTYELISGKPVLNWVQYHAETGGYDVEVRVDEATWDNTTGGRTFFRFGMDGPHAADVFEKVIEGPTPEMKFFHTARVRIGGVDVLALRHGMAGHKGVELSGPFSEYERIREILLEAGAEFGIKPGGQRAYFSTVIEGGWISYPLPAIYTAEELRSYREWLPASGWEARFQLGGSFYPQSLEEHYVTPFDLGYDKIVAFDHDFIGRDALEKLSAAPPRTKVTLVWNAEDVERVYASQFGDRPNYKAIEFPLSDYVHMQRDTVLADGRQVGLSTHGGYSANEKAALSLCIIDRDYAAPGTEVEIVWGEPGGGSRKPNVEAHEQTRIRATVAPVPYASFVREEKYVTLGA